MFLVIGTSSSIELHPNARRRHIGKEKKEKGEKELNETKKNYVSEMLQVVWNEEMSRVNKIDGKHETAATASISHH